MNAEMSSRFKELTAKFPRAFLLSAHGKTVPDGGLFQLFGEKPKDPTVAAFPFLDLHSTPSGGAADRVFCDRWCRSAADGASWLLKSHDVLRKKATPPVVPSALSAAPPPTSPVAAERDDGRYLGWFGDGTVPYPEALWARYHVPLDRLLIVKTPSAEETWRLGAEACGSGLFRALCLQPSQGTDGTTLRRLQLEAERHAVIVALLTNAELPHWPLAARWRC